MGLLDKMKGAMNAVTGGGAKVTLEFTPATAFPGDVLKVKIAATSTGAEVKSKGIFVDLEARESVRVKSSEAGSERDISVSKATFEKAFNIAKEFVLPPNETKNFEGTITLPSEIQPSFEGTFVKHEWQIRGRVEAFGNDPDSGFKPIRVGLKV